MAEEKKGKRPSGNIENAKVGQGQEKAPVSGEVSGHMSPGATYICWRCASLNYVPFGYTYFVCWNDGALNVV